MGNSNESRLENTQIQSVAGGRQFNSALYIFQKDRAWKIGKKKVIGLEGGGLVN